MANFQGNGQSYNYGGFAYAEHPAPGPQHPGGAPWTSTQSSVHQQQPPQQQQLQSQYQHPPQPGEFSQSHAYGGLYQQTLPQQHAQHQQQQQMMQQQHHPQEYGMHQPYAAAAQGYDAYPQWHQQVPPQPQAPPLPGQQQPPPAHYSSTYGPSYYPSHPAAPFSHPGHFAGAGPGPVPGQHEMYSPYPQAQQPQPYAHPQPPAQPQPQPPNPQGQPPLPANYYDLYQHHAQPPLPEASPPEPDNNEMSIDHSPSAPPPAPTQPPQISPDASDHGAPQPPLPSEAAMASESTLALPPTPVGCLLYPPYRASRPRSLVVIIRGIPGSGKSWLAQRLRDVERAQGGATPRVLSIDPYFIVEPDEDDGPAKEEYRFDASSEGRYQDNLLVKLRQTVAEARHPFIIVDAPLLQAAAVQAFWAAGKAASYEVYVTQAPDQNPDACYQRNTHGRSFVDVTAAAHALEPIPPAALQLDCAALVHGEAHLDPHATPSDPQASQAPADPSKRKFREFTEAGGTAFRDATQKRTRGMDISDSDLLASVDAGFVQDAATGQTAGAARPRSSSRSEGVSEPKSRWEMDDDDEDGAGASASAAAGQGTASESVDAKLRAILSGGGSRGRVRKTVRWPDQLQEDEEEQGFRIGKPRQLEIVHLVEGLGPGSHDQQQQQHSTFAEAVRAEHANECRAHGPEPGSGWGAR